MKTPTRTTPQNRVYAKKHRTGSTRDWRELLRISGACSMSHTRHARHKVRKNYYCTLRLETDRRRPNLLSVRYCCISDAPFNVRHIMIGICYGCPVEDPQGIPMGVPWDHCRPMGHHQRPMCDTWACTTNPRVSHGSPMATMGPTRGSTTYTHDRPVGLYYKPMGLLRVAHGRPMGDPWAPHGPAIYEVCACSTRGPVFIPITDPWVAHEKPMYTIWRSRGEPWTSTVRAS